jgi:hypothetical protein
LDPHLNTAVKIVAKKDAGAFRQQIFAELTRRKWVIRFVMSVHRILGKSWLSTALVALYGLKSFMAIGMPRVHGSILTTARYRNEERQLDYLSQVCGKGLFSRIDLNLATLFNPFNWGAALLALLRPHGVARYLKIVHQYNQGGDFLVACRVASTVGYFARFLRLLKGSSATATLVTSDSNPYAMGLSYAGRALGLKSIYITHGHIPDSPPVLDFDLSILDGQAVLDVYRESGPEPGVVVFKGAEGDYRPMDVSGLQNSHSMTVGVFLSLLVDWESFANVLERLQSTLNPKKLILRLHPNQLMQDPIAHKIAARWDNLRLSNGHSILNDDAGECDLVFAAGSSCHLSVLKFGVPTVSLSGLDVVPHDFYRFIGRGIVPHVDTIDELDVAWVGNFFSQPDWVARFHVFDAAYPAQQEECNDAVKNAVGRMLS